MTHRPSDDDLDYRRRFAEGEVAAGEFDHVAHVRLAYVELCEHDVDTAYERVREALHGFLERHGVDPAKYHETLTRSWMLAVRHFMDEDAGADSFAEFFDRNPRLGEPEIMLSHYSEAALFSDDARAAFVEPDRAPIPEPRDDGTPE